MAGPASVYTPLPSEQGTAAAPPLGFLDSVEAGFRRGRSGEDWGVNQANYEGRVMFAIREQAAKRGYRIQGQAPSANTPYGAGTLEAAADRETDALLRWAKTERDRDPGFLPDYAGIDSRQALREWALQKRREDMAKADSDLQGGSLPGQLIGALGAGLLDPTSYVPVGGQAARAGSIIRQMGVVAGREAAANVAVTAALEPLTQMDAAALGVERTAGDVLAELGMAGVVGGVIGGAAKGLEIGVTKGADAIQRRRADAGTLTEREAIAAARAAVPEANMTPDEREAIAVAERALDVAETSPFVAGAGDAAHVERMNAAMAKARGGAAAARPAPPRTVTRGDVAAGRFDPASVRAPARAQVKALIRTAESSGNDRATNTQSSASGRYQFVKGTWVSYYQRRYGTAGGREAAWAKRFDPALQEILMDDLLADNARRLADAGIPETAGNLYILHFAGERGGIDLLRAAPDTPTTRLFSAKTIAANRSVLEGKTAGDVIAWADRKMGGDGAAPPVRMAEAAGPLLEDVPEIERSAFALDPFPPRADWLDQAEIPPLRTDLFATPEEHARAQLALSAERDAMEGFARIVDDPPAPGPAIDIKAAPRRQRSGPPDVMRTIAEAGGLRDDGGHDLVKGRGIPKFMLGAGTIIRADGRPLDEIGEILWEQGFFGPASTTERPGEYEVLELIERARAGKVYLPEAADAMRIRAERAGSQSEEEARWELGEAAREIGAALDPITLDDALARRAQGATAEEAVSEAIDAARFRDLGTSAGLERFDQPDGDGAAMQIDSLEHDLRMAMDGEDGAYQTDAEGDAVSLSEMLEELDEADRAAAALRACMAPRKEAA